MRLALLLLLAATFKAHAYNTNIMHQDDSDAGKVPVTATRLSDDPSEGQPPEARPATAKWKGFDSDGGDANGSSPAAGGYAQPSSGSSYQPQAAAPYGQPSASSPNPSAAIPSRMPAGATIPQGQPLNPTQFPTVQSPAPSQPTAQAPAEAASGTTNTGGFLGIRGAR